MDSINMNVFKQIKKNKNAPITDKKIGKPEDKKINGMVLKKIQKPIVSNDQQMENILKDENKLIRNKIQSNNNGVTTIAGLVRDKNNLNQAELVQFIVKTTKAEQPMLDFNSQPFPISKNKPTDVQALDSQLQDLFINTLKNNKLTFGTRQMMDNEMVHAQEAINSGIYITWTIKTDKGTIVDCFRIGSNSLCVCTHGFTSHDKILTKKKLSNKCNDCKCKAFTYIPQYPEEIGEYWLPHKADFDYKVWRPKCKCKHAWNEHFSEKFLKCRKCNCGLFNSAFCCVVCNKYWQDHEMVYELEHERYMNKKAIGEDFIPLKEAPEISNILYKN